MRALLANLAMMQHDDVIGALNRRKPVRHDNGGAIAHYPGDRLLNQLLGFRVDRAGRFVQDQQGRVEGQRPRKRDQLLLPD